MEAFENAILKLTLVTGCISGFSPPSNPFQGCSEFKYKFSSLISRFSWLQLFLVFGVGIFFNAVSMTREDFLLTQAMSDFLLFFGCAIVYYFMEVIRRIVSLLNAKELISLVRRCGGIPGGMNPRILSLLVLTSTANITKHILHLYYLYFYKGMLLGLDSSNQVQVLLFFMTNLSTDISGWLSGYFVTCIVLIIGSRLSTAHRGLCRDFEVQFLENIKKSKDQSSKGGAITVGSKLQHDLDYFETEFQKLKQSFGDFQPIAGTYALAFVTEGIMTIVYFLFDIYQPDSVNINGRASDVLAIVEAFFTIFSFAHIGTFIETEVSFFSQQQQEHFVVLSLHFPLTRRYHAFLYPF